MRRQFSERTKAKRRAAMYGRSAAYVMVHLSHCTVGELTPAVAAMYARNAGHYARIALGETTTKGAATP